MFPLQYFQPEMEFQLFGCFLLVLARVQQRTYAITKGVDQ
jgi:hypothetical protein